MTQDNNQLSPHFTLTELACRCSCGGEKRPEILANLKKLAAMLEQVREAVGKPVVLNCGYRCPKHNAEVGGEPGSYHLQGMAADIKVKGLPPRTVQAVCATLKSVHGLGKYETFTHVDVRGQRVVWHG